MEGLGAVHDQLGWMKVWDEFDITLSGKITMKQLPLFFEKLGPPLCKCTPIPVATLHAFNVTATAVCNATAVCCCLHMVEF